jgi:hypothetical protein
MLFPVTLKAMRPLTGSYGWPPPVGSSTNVNPGEMFTTDNQTAVRLEASGLAERMDKPRASIQPSPDILAIIQGLRRRMGQVMETPVAIAPENKMVSVAEDKNGEQQKRGRGRPPGSRNRSK